jgi:uncharacterized protein YdeI (YjbR/CyaY-like superfamily)
LPVLAFSGQPAFHDWLNENHASAPGIWIRIPKKNSAMTGINYGQALEEALCYGWIDSSMKKFDESCYIQKFSPRKKNSIWSKNNKEKVKSLVREGRMQPSGLLTVEDAKKSGNWDRAYEPQSKIKIPADFREMLEENREADAFFKSLDPLNRYAILFRIQKQKKGQARSRKMNDFLEMLRNKKKVHQ